MVKNIFFILDKYGFNIAILSCLIFLVYKLGFELFNNHLNHISLSLEDNSKEIKAIGKEVTILGKKVAKIEGRIKI